MYGFTKKEKYLIINTLNCVPLILQGQGVLIDLRNETSVAGTIDSADGSMNINLKPAVFIDRAGLQYPFENFMVRERMIRQIHIPPSVDMDKELQQWTEHGMKRKKHPSQDRKGKRTFKQKRAEERHKEILAEIEKQKKETTTSKDI